MTTTRFWPQISLWIILSNEGWTARKSWRIRKHFFFLQRKTNWQTGPWLLHRCCVHYCVPLGCRWPLHNIQICHTWTLAVMLICVNVCRVRIDFLSMWASVNACERLLTIKCKCNEYDAAMVQKIRHSSCRASQRWSRGVQVLFQTPPLLHCSTR